MITPQHRRRHLTRVQPVVIGAVAVTFLFAIALRAGPPDAGTVAERVRLLTRDSAWQQVHAVPIGFTTYHPQGMVKIGEMLFVSSVQVTRPTRRLPRIVDGLDRDAGQGIGHLFKIDLAGNLVASVRLGEGALYHPSGLDYDGTHIWVAVAEYRPASRSIIYRVDPATMQATEVFRFADHLGAIVHNTDDRTLHGVSWGSRHFYRWPLGADGTVTNAAAALKTANPSHYVDYQDCRYVGGRRMLCTGVADVRSSPNAPALRLGGIDLVDLRDGRPLHQVPLRLWTAGGLPMTQNPVWLESAEGGLRGYFMPEDDRSTLYVFEVRTP